MATNFDSVSDDDLTALLQAHFHETVRLQVMLEDAESEGARLKEERRKLVSRIKKSHEEISRVVREMKRRVPDIRGGIRATTKTPSMPIQSDLMHQVIFTAAR